MSRSAEMQRVEREERESWGIPDRDGKIRSAWGVRARQGFYPMLAPAPVGPCNRERAAQYVREIERVIDEPDIWTRQERSSLSRLRTKWKRRADGLDARFEAMGGVYGGTNERCRPKTPADTIVGLKEMAIRYGDQPVRMLTDAERYAPLHPEQSGAASMSELVRPRRKPGRKPRERSMSEQVRAALRGVGQFHPVK